MNKKVVIVIVVIVILGGGIAFAAAQSASKDLSDSHSGDHSMSSDMNSSSESDPTESEVVTNVNEVMISDYAYSPQNIEVKVGTTVTWTNEDAVAHDVMPVNESDDSEAGPLLREGQSYSYTFEKPGTYESVTPPIYDGRSDGSRIVEE